MSARAFLIGLAVLATAGCERLPSEMTCHSLRSLHVGMREEDVAATIGFPRFVNPGFSVARPEIDSEWVWVQEPFWQGHIGGATISCEIDDHRVKKCGGYQKWIDDGTVEDLKHQSLFDVDANGFRETAEFRRTFHCGS